MVLGKSYYAENIFIPTWSWYWVQQTYFCFLWDRYMLMLGDFYFNEKHLILVLVPIPSKNGTWNLVSSSILQKNNYDFDSNFEI
jgi:hypothetical protein